MVTYERAMEIAIEKSGEDIKPYSCIELEDSYNFVFMDGADVYYTVDKESGKCEREHSNIGDLDMILKAIRIIDI